MLSYIIVGSGYRAEYYAKVASIWPDLFRALFLCRSEEKVKLVQAHTGMPGTTDISSCLAFRPDFVVVAVDRGHIADVAEEWLDRGFPVVTETPVGDTVEKLINLWEKGQSGVKIVCCEQYHRYPILSNGLAMIREGKIGVPYSLYISMLHDYHAASLIRRGLLVQPGEPFTVLGQRQEKSVKATDSRYGAILDGSEQTETRDTAIISFASGKQALYDFSPVQYRSFIRSRHLTIRGNRGEWSDTQVLWLDEENRARRSVLVPDLAEKYRCLDTQFLRDKRRNWTSELAPDTLQDEFAIASILFDMEEYLCGGPAPYPLAEAMEDAYFWLLLQEAMQSPGQTVFSKRMPWHIQNNCKEAEQT